LRRSSGKNRLQKTLPVPAVVDSRYWYGKWGSVQLLLLGCLITVYNTIFYFTIPKEQRRLRSEPGRLSARSVYKFKRGVKLPWR